MSGAQIHERMTDCSLERETRQTLIHNLLTYGIYVCIEILNGSQMKQIV